MPTQCSAIGCSNRFDPEAKKRGISFHKVPSDPERREAWKRALRRDFVITKHTVICSDHFEEKDLDRTGQTNRLRDGVTPSIFNFPDQDQDDPDQLRRSRRSRKKTKKARSTNQQSKRKSLFGKYFCPRSQSHQEQESKKPGSRSMPQNAAQ
uniref:THAP-type domain-containing protein n=1 Tax=Neogobius melanostomus TaxID=47308 RepID=A0A8C6UCV8_9GOBI